MANPAPKRQSSRVSKSARIRSFLASGMSAAEIAKKVGCSTNLVYVVKSTATGKTTDTQQGARRGPGRPPKASVSYDGLDGILASVKNSERERTALRAALVRIQDVIADALA